MKKNPFIGKWLITEMEQWDSDFINEEESGYFEFDRGDQGDFRFGYVQGSMDCEIETVDGEPRIEFSWDGIDEMDEAMGRGWARIVDNGTMYGKIIFHMGDRSWFKAKRMKSTEHSIELVNPGRWPSTAKRKKTDIASYLLPELNFVSEERH